MNTKPTDNKLTLADRIAVFADRFRELPAVSWAITTGAVTIFAALQAVAFPNLKGAPALFAYGAVLVLSVLAAGWYAVRRPSLSQRMIEARRHYNAGCIAFEDKRYEAAIAEFKLACEKDPDNYPHLSKYGRACLRLGRYHEAIDVLTQSHDLAPTKEGKLTARRNRGVAALVVNNFGLAHSDFTEYLDTNKKTSAVFRLRALVYLATGDLKEAEADARKAASLAPELCTVHATLAAILASCGDTTGARKALDQANHCDHEKADALYALAQAHAKLKDSDEALRRLKKAVQIDPKFGPRAALDVLFTDLRHDGQCFAEAIDTGGVMVVGSLEGDD
ncbi:MAG TPA: tetratricopeptide repeat protein [Geobacteraceae bacterium]